MATLHFKGKTAVWNHHLSVPYHTLEKVKENSQKGKDEEENLIIEGDNLLALKALLPKYQGRVKCIYIDPPYNTGQEGWVYNDNVNNPVIKDWLGRVVGKEGEDLVRHDKWLCMMTPRLKLLRELLRDDGVIFVSIDDNEVHHLRSLMDEVFGEGNFVTEFVWQRKSSVKGVPPVNMLVKTHEYILCYSKSEKYSFIGEKRSADTFSNPDNDPRGPWRNTNIKSTVKSSIDAFEITDPATGNVFKDAWAFSKKQIEVMIQTGQIIFPKKPTGQVRAKEYFHEFKNENKPLSSLLGLYDGQSITQNLTNLMGEKYFEYPKSVLLLKYLFKVTLSEGIVLDSFAGSGTTAQAVLELNQEDGGNRKCILVQLPETIAEGKPAYEAGYRFVHEITRNRVKRVVERDKLDVGFTYYKLGPDIDGRKLLAGKNLPSWDNLAKYVHFLATGKPADDVTAHKKTGEIISGKTATGVYLLYAPTLSELKQLAITRDWLDGVKEKQGKKVVYAPACFIDKELLDENNLSFVQLPFNLFARK